MTPDEVTDHLVARGTWTFSRSSGPGGQRRDKAETRVELAIGPDALAGLPMRVRDRLARGLGITQTPVRFAAEDHRERERNREAVIGRLGRRVRQALAPPPPRRKRTRPSRAARERRLAGKTRRGQVKKLRRRPGADD